MQSELANTDRAGFTLDHYRSEEKQSALINAISRRQLLFTRTAAATIKTGIDESKLST